jgi:thioredoxin reductase
VERLEIDGDRLVGVRMADGRVIEREAVVVAPRFAARSRVLADLGLRPVEHQMGFGEYIPSGPGGLTDVPGVRVAGNVTDLSAQVVAAAAGGVAAAAAINADLVDEDTRLAVAARRVAVPTTTLGRAS